ncbi:MAG TPA: TrmH family RNA methyltransferase [Anaerolineae bacterium]|nr:TrmH family RNA methyltransferase [Anaerolineae bacterium]HRA21537.1 TrmH family RNA methyltransferase [Anaerolineae bacterium]
MRATDLKRQRRADRRDLPAGRRLAFLLENVAYPVNVGSLFRIADACGAEVMALAGTTPEPSGSPNFQRASRGKEAELPWRHFSDSGAALDWLLELGFTPVAVELTDRARPYHLVTLPPATALVLGNEEHGVTRACLARCPQQVYVPMLGQGASLNVHVAAAVVAFRARYPGSEPSKPAT